MIRRLILLLGVFLPLLSPAQPSLSLWDHPLLPPGREEVLFSASESLLLQPVQAPESQKAHLERAASFLLLGEDSSALQALEGLRKASPSLAVQARADFLAGVARFHLGDYERSLANFQSSLGKDSSFAFTLLHFCQGRALYALGRYPEALESFTRVYPESIRTLEEGEIAYYAGACLLALKRYEEAAQAFRLFLSKTKNPALLAEANFFFGLSEFFAGKLPEASEAFRRTLLAHPRFAWDQAAKRLVARPGPLPLQPVPWHHDTLGGQNQYTDDGLFLLAWCDYRSGEFDEAESLATYLDAYFPHSGYGTQSRLLFALALYDQGKKAEAEPSLRSLAQTPWGDEALFRLGLLYASSGHPLWASRAFEKLWEEHPRSAYVPQALFRAGELAYGRRDYPYSRTLFLRLLREHPSSELASEAQWALGWAAYRQGRYREAHQTFEAYAAAPPSARDAQAALFRSGVSAFLAGEEESAVLALKKVTALDPAPEKRDSALWLVAQSYDRLKRPGKAAESWQEFLASCPSHPSTSEAELALGKAWLESGEFKAAIPAFDQAERIARTESLRDEARYHRELARLGKRGRGDPLLVAQRFIAHYPESPRAPRLLLDIAQYQWAVRRPERALATLARLAEDYPSSPEAPRGRLLRGKIFEDRGDPGSAIREYEAGLERRDPEASPQALLGLAGCYQGLRQYDLARDQLRRLLADYWSAPETEGALLEMASSYNREGRYAEALEAYQFAEARTRGRKRMEAQLGQGNCLLGEALYAKAVGAFIKLSHQSDIPRDLLAQSLYGQGAAQSALGDTTRALEAFARARDLTTDPQAKADLQRQIDLLAQKGRE